MLANQHLRFERGLLVEVYPARCAFRRYGMADMVAKTAAQLTEPLQAEGALVERIQAEPHHEVALRAVLVGESRQPGRSSW